MGILIKIQSYKDWKKGHIKKSEVIEGKTILSEHKTAADVAFDKEMDQALDELFSDIQTHNIRIAKTEKDWSKAPHHKHCCCDRCAPTKEDLHRKIEEFNKEAGKNTSRKIVSVLDCDHKGDTNCELCYENLAPSDCET